MASSVRLAFFVGVLLCVVNCVQCWPGTDSADVPATQKPSTVYFKKSLEQLKKMEESALKGWYDMVQKFLTLIKPVNETLEIIIDYAQGASVFEFPSSVIDLAQRNSVFIAMISLGLIYVIVMLLAGFFFFCCRMFGRCGAKESQQQTQTITCWKTTHKFGLIFMIACLIVPIISMVIINQHMSRSYPSIKSNASDIFPMLSGFANSTEAEVNDLARTQLDNIFDRVQDTSNVEKGFAKPLEEDISKSLSNESIEYMINISTWILKVIEEDVPAVRQRMDSMSNSVQYLQNLVRNLTEETEKFNRRCSEVGANICHMALKRLSPDKLNLSSVREIIERNLDKLGDIDVEKLRNISMKIQNNTLLSDMIKEKKDSLKNFARDLKPKQDEILRKIKVEVKTYADQVREFSNEGQKFIEKTLTQSEPYEHYRWWLMFGIAIVLFLPVMLLILGLIFGCCGYRKDYHPSKRSFKSHCGGRCLVLSVYYFFIVSWILMLFTVAMFILGGSLQSFGCMPLYEDEFVILDKVKVQLEVTYPNLNDLVLPSKFLSNCRDDKSVFEALDFGVLNRSSSQILREELEKNLRDDEIEKNLRSSISQEIDKINRQFDNYSSLLNLSESRDLPKNLSNNLSEVRQNIEDTKMKVKDALSETSSSDLEMELQLIEKIALDFTNMLDNFSKDLDNFSYIISRLYDQATFYMQKVGFIKTELRNVELKIPGFVHERLFSYLMSVVNTDLFASLLNIGHCEDLWLAFDTSRTVICDFIVYPINGFWFSLGWALVFIIPTIIFSIKLSRHYLRMKYDTYRFDDRETAPLDDMSRIKPTPFSYTPGNTWMPQQNYMVHPTSSNHIRQFNYK